MSKIPSDAEIKTEMARIGGTGGDYFSAQTRLQHRLDEAALAVEKLKPAGGKTEAEPWQLEPTADQILAEGKNFGLTNEDARESVKKKLATDAKRLASFSAAAAAEINAALAEAESARERAANILMEHEAALNGVTSGIFAVGNIRKKIHAAKSLCLDDASARTLAKTALDFWVDKQTISETVQNSTGFRAFAEDLVWRQALNTHIAEYVTPLEKQAATIITSVHKQADDAKMDMKKVFALLASERGQRGESLLHDSNFYAGLI